MSTVEASSSTTSKAVHPSWTAFLDNLESADVDRAIIEENLEFIKQFVRDYEQNKPTPKKTTRRFPPPPATGKHRRSHGANGSVSGTSPLSPKQHRPPPPPVRPAQKPPTLQDRARLYSDGKPDRAAATSDGRGGIESVPEAESGPRYIYYRLYVADGPLESVNPIYSNDRFISRILPKSVAPPHTAASLKKYLCRIEGFETAEKCTLFLSLVERVPIEDDTRLSLRAKSGPGLSELEPMALIVDTQACHKRSPAPSNPPSEQLDETATRYVHYRVYEESGEVASKTSFDEDDSSLGRINMLCVPPPHTVASLKAHLAKAEGASGRSCQLFEDGGGEITMKDDDIIIFLTDSYPGASEEEPIAVVYSKPRETTSQPTAAVSPLAPRGFSKRIEAVESDLKSETDPLWHSASVGEIFHTDGVLRKEVYRGNGLLHCYIAINSSGKMAFIFATKMRFC